MDDDEPAIEQVEYLAAELRTTRVNGETALRQMWTTLVRELRQSERRADRLQKNLKATRGELKTARRRARHQAARARRAEQQLAEIQASRTWQIGRTVTAVPRRLRRRG